MTRTGVEAAVKCAAYSVVLGHPNCPEEMEEIFVKYENHLMTFPDEKKRARYWQCKVCDTKHLHTTKCIEDHLKTSHSMTASKYDEKFNEECAIVYDNCEDEKR